MNHNVLTIQNIYNAFGRDNVDVILSHLADEIRWEELSENYAQKAGASCMRPAPVSMACARFFKLYCFIQLANISAT